MQGSHLLLPIVLPGTWTTNVHFEFIAPFDLQLERVSANCDTLTSFNLAIGTTASTSAYLVDGTVTGSTTDSTEYGLTDFVGDQYPHILKGTFVCVTFTHDGGAGNDAANATILLTFSEG